MSVGGDVGRILDFSSEDFVFRFSQQQVDPDERSDVRRPVRDASSGEVLSAVSRGGASESFQRLEGVRADPHL